MLTKEAVIRMLETDKRAVARALVVLHNRQTHDEQAQEGTRYLNGRGFRPCHARMGSSMAKFFLRTGMLTDKQVAYWRVVEKTGSMRIGIYWAQLLEEAQRKAAEKAQIDACVGRMKTVEVPKIHDYGRRGATPSQVAAIGKGSLPGLEGSAWRTTDRDYGNDMEQRMVLQEQLGDVLDSDDPKLVEPIARQIDEIDAFWAKIRAGK